MTTATDKVRVPDSVSAQVEEECRRRYPAEACGFLLGEDKGSGYSIEAARPAVNRASRDDRFHIDAHQVFEAMRAAPRNGKDLLGVYHSHPDGVPEPSSTDRQDAWGRWLYLIVACAGGESTNSACWRFERDRFVPLTIEGDSA